MGLKLKNPFKGKKINVKKIASTVKTKVLNTAKKVESKAQKTSRKAKQLIKNAKEVGQIALLAPFKKLMVKQLKAKGIKVPNNLEDIARSFFQNVVRRNSYDETEYFDPNNPIVMKPLDDWEYDTIDPITISAVVSGIVSFFKKIKEKKDNGEQLTPTQQTIAKQVEEVERDVDNIRDDETDRTVGKMIQQYWYVVVIVIAGVVYFAAKASKK